MIRNVLLVIFMVIAAPAVASHDILEADVAWREAKAGKLVIIDIRSAAEWKDTGIPKGARTVTIHDPKGLEGFYKALLAAVNGDKTTRIALICAAGGRSARAERYLATKGFTRIVDISEGMLGTWRHPGWIKRGLPVEPYED